MLHVPKPITNQLSLALKHYRHASRNLHSVHHWALQNDREHLEQGVLNLIDQASRVTGDLSTLIMILEARGALVANYH